MNLLSLPSTLLFVVCDESLGSGLNPGGGPTNKPQCHNNTINNYHVTTVFIRFCYMHTEQDIIF